VKANRRRLPLLRELTPQKTERREKEPKLRKRLKRLGKILTKWQTKLMKKRKNNLNQKVLIMMTKMKERERVMLKRRRKRKRRSPQKNTLQESKTTHT